MDIATYREIAGRGELLDADELQAWMREQATEAQRITAEINGSFHTPEELRAQGVAVDFADTVGTMHGYDIARRSPFTREALRRRVGALRAAFGSDMKAPPA